MNSITEINHKALARAFQAYRGVASAPKDVLLLSPSVDDVGFVRHQFRDARVFVATRNTWDLNLPFPTSSKVDLVVASNVFHYSGDPNLWFRNVLDMTGFFILQDLIVRRRSPAANGLCGDGDSVRYCYRAKAVESEFTGAYDLSVLQNQLLFFEEYEGGRNEYHVAPAPAPRHFCAVVKAEVAAARPPLTWPHRDFLRFRLPGIRMIAQSMLR